MSHEAYFTSYEWVEDTLAAKAACITGVALGANTVVLRAELRRVARGHGRFSEQTLLRMQHFSGFCLLALGLFDGGHIAWQLAQAHEFEDKIFLRRRRRG